MNYAEIRSQAVMWMAQRGWKKLWGKRGALTQSLLQHTDIELNALCTLLPILEQKAHYALTETEKQALIVGTIAHDTGKETAAWQAYVQQPRETQKGQFVRHIIPELTEAVVPELVAFFGFDPAVVSDAIVFVNLHMKSTRTPTNLMSVLTGKTGGSNRWAVLARIVDTIDNFCSVRGLLPTLDVLRRDAETGGAVGPHIQLGYHLLSLRGVSTILLHRAAEDAYRETGWSPLLYFSNGTIYIADSLAEMSESTASMITGRLGKVVEAELPTAFFPKMVVGSPAATMIPKPELFDYRELTLYLQESSRRVKRGSFLRKPESVRLSKMKDNRGGGYWQLSNKLEAEQNLAVDSERIDRAQPLMMIFKLFRDAMKPEIAGKVAGLADRVQLVELAVKRDDAVGRGDDPDKAQTQYDKAAQKLEKQAASEFESRVATLYDTVFGAGTFARLRSTSTLMPAREMVAVIDSFWTLPGSALGLPHQRVELAPDEQVQTALITKLDEIARAVYEELPESQRPVRINPTQIAQCFQADIIRPAPPLDPRQVAEQQRNAYLNSKPEAMRERQAARLCPICNSPFQSGTAAAADFVAKPDSHTNRAVSHGFTGKVIICDACKYERFLQQLLLGEKVARALVLMPRMHVGYWAGQTFSREAHRFYDEALTLMSNSTTDPNEHVTLALTNVIAGKLLREDEEGSALVRAVQEGLDGSTLAHLLTYNLTPGKQKDYLRELSKALRDEYEFEEGKEDVAALNEEWETAFPDWDSIVRAVFRGDVHNDIVDDVRARVYRLRPQFQVVCQTPNFVLVPLTNNFAVGDESETNVALRELFVLLLLGLALDCSVAAIDAGEPITLEGGEGVARVPAVPAVRDLVGSDWVGLDDAPRWLEKIGAASLLAGDTAYPKRSNLYQILSAPTPGHVLRRIELEQKQRTSIRHAKLILKALQEVPHA